MHLVNDRTRAPIATDVELAVTRATRRRGLLGRDGLSRSAAMLIAPCIAVHTAFMRFSIDVVFIDRDGHVVKVVRDLAPWRMTASPSAYAVIELPVNATRDILMGDRLYLVATSPADREVSLPSGLDLTDSLPQTA